MSRSGQEFIAQTQGTEFTMYRMMECLGLKLSPDQEKFQRYLENKYPPVVTETVMGEYHKGEPCPYRQGVLCQEGYCSECNIRKELDNG